MRFVCGEPSAENQWAEMDGGRRNKSFVCMHSRNCIIDIIISYRGGAVSKSPGHGDFFRLVLM